MAAFICEVGAADMCVFRAANATTCSADSGCEACPAGLAPDTAWFHYPNCVLLSWALLANALVSAAVGAWGVIRIGRAIQANRPKSTARSIAFIALASQVGFAAIELARFVEGGAYAATWVLTGLNVACNMSLGGAVILAVTRPLLAVSGASHRDVDDFRRRITAASMAWFLIEFVCVLGAAATSRAPGNEGYLSAYAAFTMAFTISSLVATTTISHVVVMHTAKLRDVIKQTADAILPAATAGADSPMRAGSEDLRERLKFLHQFLGAGFLRIVIVSLLIPLHFGMGSVPFLGYIIFLNRNVFAFGMGHSVAVLVGRRTLTATPASGRSGTVPVDANAQGPPSPVASASPAKKSHSAARRTTNTAPSEPYRAAPSAPTTLAVTPAVPTSSPSPSPTPTPTPPDSADIAPQPA